MAEPIVKTYNLNPVCEIVTTISGDARNIAQVEIKSGAETVYSGTMMQQSPDLKTQQDYVLGTFTLKAGAHFHLTIPTSLQSGNVVLKGESKSEDNPFAPFSAQVADWKSTD
jgi:hypothetical protein